MALVAMTFANDAAAYVGGRLLGRHRVAAKVSPGNTWEGAAAGAAGSVVAAAVFGALWPDALRLTDCAATALITSAVGPVGDLSKSLLKRSAGAKDSSHLLPGHGGVLDRIDALVANAVAVWLWVIVTKQSHAGLTTGAARFARPPASAEWDCTGRRVCPSGLRCGEPAAAAAGQRGRGDDHGAVRAPRTRPVHPTRAGSEALMAHVAAWHVRCILKGMMANAWVSADNVGLLVDQYELTMLDAYLREGLTAKAVFSLFVRKLPSRRNYLVACGLEQLLDLLEHLRFSHEAVGAAARMGALSRRAEEWLERFRFSGDVWAVPEGTPIFDGEPLVEVVAPLPEAQLIETVLMNQLHVQTLLASKASRVVTAAQGRTVVEFGLRRAQGADAGLKAARAAYVAGVDSTSNVLAGAVFGIPVTGTMAHSYVQAHDDELDAFRSWCRTHSDSTLLVDTYDTLDGVRHVIQLAHELGSGLRVRAVRLDSGDLLELSQRARALLDDAGLRGVRIFASGGLDEDSVDALVRAGAPIDGFGIGTSMTVSTDAPTLDLAYKLVEYAGRPRMKLSTKKVLLPGRKQVFRSGEGDVIACFGEELPGRPLLQQVMTSGHLTRPSPTLDEIRRYARAELARLPDPIRGLSPARPGWRVATSSALAALLERVSAEAR